MELKRVVVTGMGVVSPLGNDIQTMWDAMMNGKSGVHTIEGWDTEKMKTKIGGEVRDFDISGLLDRKEARKLDLYAQYAIATAKQALDDSGMDLEQEDRDRIGVIWGSGMGGIRTITDELEEYFKGDGTPRFNPFFIPKAISNIAAGQISLYLGLRGINFATVSACASSSHAIADAFNYVRLGKANAIFTGGSDSAVIIPGIGGFNALHALSTRNDDPERASRPYSKSRDGFVLSEGGGCLILEEYEHAKARGAHIYAEMVGAGMNADAHHLTAPDPEGSGAAKVMMLAMEDAEIKPEMVDYINTHGTSTPLGDVAELKAIHSVWGEDAYRLNISSTKSMTGHLVGATGALEAISTVLAIHHSMVPPTINHDEEDQDENIDYRMNFTFNKPQARQLRYALSNTFGFGGHNASLLFKNPNC